MAEYIPKDVFKVFTAHDISTISFFRRVGQTISIKKFLSSIFSGFQVLLFEEKYLPRFDQINTVSQTDHDYLQKYFHLKSTIVPNGIDKVSFIRKNISKFIRLGFIGSSSHPPNLSAINYFLDKISPLLEKSKIDYKFFLAGHNPNITDPRIINLGSVNDVFDFFSKIDILIAPILAGSGTRLKILESLSNGIPVITTTVGAEGLNINSNLLQISNSPHDFFDKIIRRKPITPLDLSILENQLQPYLWTNIFNNYYLGEK